DLVAFAGCKLIPVDNSMTVVINPTTGSQQAVMPQVVATMKACTHFNTIEAHTKSLVTSHAELQGQEQMVASTLAHLHAEGLLQNAAEVCERLSDSASAQPAPTRVFVLTCDRPESLKRLLDSMQRTGRLSQHDALFLIDDSRASENRALNREAVVEFNLTSPRDMYYMGEEAQNTLVQSLLEQLPEHAEGIRFLLDRSEWQDKNTYGRARTLALLCSVGYRALVMDDDILCQTVLPPVSEDNIGIGSANMRKATFYPSINNLLDNAVTGDFDPLSGHARLLGKSLGSALHTINGGPLSPAQLLGANAAMAGVLKADSPILVSQCGSLGDPGTGTHWVQFLGPDSVRRLLSAPQGVREVIENRYSWLGSGRHNIFKMPFMSQLTGLDNSQLLPPYFPAYRGEDTLFGAMLVSMHNTSVTLEYPWSVPHLPPVTRSTNMDSPIVERGSLMLLLARHLTEKIDYSDRSSPTQALKSLAQEGIRMASRSDEDLLFDYRAALAEAQSDQLRVLSSKYAQSSQASSEEWHHYLKRGIDETQKALTSQQSPTAIPGLSEGASEASLLTEFRAMANGFAGSLFGWEETRKVASDTVEDMIRSRSIYPL
ncbi:MAG: hypothetical protein AAGF35_14000, partial [Pseudomonadota bacterium]